MNKIKNFFKQLFCKHDYAWATYGGLFFNLSGETRFLACRKCGKVKKNSKVFVRNFDGS